MNRPAPSTHSAASQRLWVLASVLLVALMVPDARAASRGGTPPARPASTYERDIRPLLTQFCYDCHGNGKRKGNLALDRFPNEKALLADRKTWTAVLENVLGHVMPPRDEDQPREIERERIARWIQSDVLKCDGSRPDPGRVTMRRLNRTEYNRTIRDLVGVDFRPADDFPADDTGYGFDNIGDVLSLPPVLLEKYLDAAEAILDRALVTGPVLDGEVREVQGVALESTALGAPYNRSARILHREGEAFTKVKLAETGDYLIRVRAFGQQAGPEPPKLEFRLDGQPVGLFEVRAVEGAPQAYEVRLKVPTGDHQFGAAYINNYVNANDPSPSNRDRNLIIESLAVIGPVTEKPPPESHRRLLVALPPKVPAAEAARQVLSRFATRAFRRPVTREELDRLVTLFRDNARNGEPFEVSIKVPLQAVLVSPHFLFRGEFQKQPDNASAISPLDDYALATRLSYFLWSTMPDDELFGLARKGRLRRNLPAQVRRMLKDPRSSALTENFAGQWLQLRKLDDLEPDARRFPGFDAGLRAAMQRETSLFFEGILREDRSLLEFLDSDYTYVNARLAKHYGLEPPQDHPFQGDDFQKISLRGTPRGGLLTQASILTLTSNPTRTSPVKRGKWVLENILGTPPPPPPPNVPELSEVKLEGTLRQRMEQHRSNPLCASCHERMDPIGFGFENFDAIGTWRDHDEDHAVDAGGMLLSGETFRTPAELRAVLMKHKREEFLRCVTGKVLTYALGRGLDYPDRCAVDDIVQRLERNQYRFSALILGVVESVPFQFRRGEATP